MALSILVLGLVLTVTAVFYIHDEEGHKELVALCNNIKFIMEKRLDQHAAILESGAAFFKASDTVTRNDWKIFVASENIDKHLPGIQGTGFSLIVPKAELPRHIQQMQNEGFPEYAIKPAGDRSLYSSVIYLEPFSLRNQRAFGYDMLTEQIRRNAMEMARDSNMAVLSGKLTLMQETDKDLQTGTLMYMPVYRNGMPVSTVAQRRAAIRGWVFSPYRIKNLMQGILGSWDSTMSKGIQLKIYDDSISLSTLLFDSQLNEPLKKKVTPSYIHTLPITFNGKKWILVFTQHQAFGFFNNFNIFFILICGILISLALFFLLFIPSLTAEKRAFNLAGVLTIELEKSTRQYRELSYQLEGIFDHVPGLLFYKDKANNYVRVNKYIADAHGQSKEMLEGKNLAELYPKQEAERYYADDLEVIDSGIAKLNIEENWSAGKDIKWVSTSKIPFRNDAGEVIGVIGMSLDITERRLQEEQLKKFMILLQKSNEDLEQFAYLASHDLQEPLRMITSFLTMLNEKYSAVIDDDGKKFIHFAVDGAKRMRLIIQDLLEFSRISRSNYQAEQVDTNEVVNDIKFILKIPVEEKKAIIRSDKLPVIQFYKVPLRQIFQNLIENALKYNKEGIPPEIDIAAQEFDDHWQFSVADNGIGIDEAYFDQIFVLFKRLHNKDEYSGNGIGLAASKKFIEYKGGKIWVESGKGSIFYFTVPKKLD